MKYVVKQLREGYYPTPHFWRSEKLIFWNIETSDVVLANFLMIDSFFFILKMSNIDSVYYLLSFLCRCLAVYNIQVILKEVSAQTAPFLRRG
jgi:hypothetical protein